MIDTKKTLVTALKNVQSNVLYESAVESPTLPLITYSTIDDSVHKQGNTLGYSNIKYQVKVWTTNIKELVKLTKSIDKELRLIGLTRTYYNELKENEVIIGVMQYGGLTKEQF